MKKIIISAIILLSFIIGIFIYPQLPKKMASHWNEKGEVDGYISRFWGVFLMPFLSSIMFLLFLVIPKIDPLKENFEKFRNYFENFLIILFLFLFYLYCLTLFWNLGMRFNLIQFLIPAFGLFFYYCGILIENAKRNWFVGIRTPWTLTNDLVWQKTHKIGGRLFKISGLISFLGFFFQKAAIWFLILPLIFSTIFCIVYSFLQYQKLSSR